MEQKLTRTHGACYGAPKLRDGEDHREVSRSQACINHPETRGVQDGKGKRIAQKAEKSSSRNCTVALEDRKPKMCCSDST